MVGLAGELCGILTIRCSAKTAARMASRMLGTDLESAGPEKWDALGEICNMVAGNFKNKIAGLGDGCMLSAPTVITGGDYSLHAMFNDEVRTVLCSKESPSCLRSKSTASELDRRSFPTESGSPGRFCREFGASPGKIFSGLCLNCSARINSVQHSSSYRPFSLYPLPGFPNSHPQWNAECFCLQRGAPYG